MALRLAHFRFDRTSDFALQPEDLWSALSRTEDFRRWWPWLRQLRGGGLAPGTRAEAVVRAPLPYALRFSVEVLDIDPPRRLEARVDGDLEGLARLEVESRPGGSAVRLSWEVELRRPLLRAAARVVRPAMEWGHDWVVDTGIQQFRRALEAGQTDSRRPLPGMGDDMTVTTPDPYPPVDPPPQPVPDPVEPMPKPEPPIVPRPGPDPAEPQPDRPEPGRPGPFPPTRPEPGPDPVPDRPPMPEPDPGPVPRL